MKKLRIAALILLFLALLALFAVGGSSNPVKGQGGPWSVDYNFADSPRGWNSFAGNAGSTWVSGQGWSSNAGAPDLCSGGGDSQQNYFEIIWPTTAGDISHIQVTYSIDDSCVDSGNDLFRAWSGTGISGSPVCDISDTYINTNHTSVTDRVIDVDVSCSAGRYWLWGFNSHGSSSVKRVVISGTSGSPFTATPTLGPGPTSSAGGGGSFEGQCLLLGDDSSLFMTLPGAWTLDPSTLTHGTGGTGLKLEIGQASIVLNLNKYHKYQIALRFHVEDSGSGDIFSFKLGSTAATTVSVEASADEQTFVTASGGQNFEPDDPASSDIYTFTLKELLHVEDNGTLVIDLACIEDRTPDVQLVPQAGEDSPPGVCQSCDYTPTGNLLNDLMAIFAWLWCGLSQLFDCVLKPLLLGLWRAIIDILRWLNFVRMWAGLIWTNLGAWLGNAWTQFLYWLIGAMNNVQTAFKNIVFAFFDSPLGAFLINAIAAILNNPLSAIIANTAHTVETVAGSVGNIIQIGAYYLGLIFNAVVTILGAIPEIFIALVNGYNAAPTAVPVWAPTCSSANTFLYYPCLGSYILDNTLLDGPAYLMFILLLGLVAVNTILWTVRQLQKALAS